jgi:hypothetical protein
VVVVVGGGFDLLDGNIVTCFQLYSHLVHTQHLAHHAHLSSWFRVHCEGGVSVKTCAAYAQHMSERKNKGPYHTADVVVEHLAINTRNDGHYF